MHVNEKGYLICPYCGKSTKTKVSHDTILRNFPLYCSWCKTEIKINYMPEPRARAIT